MCVNFSYFYSIHTYCLLYVVVLYTNVTQFFYRLGGGDHGASEIMDHVFYSSINWQDIYDRKASETSQLFLGSNASLLLVLC